MAGLTARNGARKPTMFDLLRTPRLAYVVRAPRISASHVDCVVDSPVVCVIVWSAISWPCAAYSCKRWKSVKFVLTKKVAGMVHEWFLFLWSGVPSAFFKSFIARSRDVELTASSNVKRMNCGVDVRAMPPGIA